MRDLHTHTNFCDGKNTPEEMIVAAIQKGMDCIGFSAHSYTIFDQSYCMSQQNTERYKQEIGRLKKIYGDKIGNEPIRLTKKEIELLWTLASNANKVFSRDSLLDKLWGFDFYGDSRTVDSHIKRLRAKVDEFPHEGWEIETIWGVGYKFAIKQE